MLKVKCLDSLGQVLEKLEFRDVGMFLDMVNVIETTVKIILLQLKLSVSFSFSLNLSLHVM
jgi:hypothetical protein